MTVPLKGKVVVITGASSGFGKDAAHLFAAEGARVVLTARRIERMQAEVELIQAAGGEAIFIPMDVSVLEDIDRMVKTVMDQYGRIDILFNNAGFGRLDWFSQLDLQTDIHTQVDVNLVGLMNVTHAVLPGMLAQHSGQIINMSSVAGWIAAPMYTVYAATKYGVRGFTNALRREVRTRGVTVSAIYPGFARTEFGRHIGSSVLRTDYKTPTWMFMTSEYVARQVVNLAKHPRASLVIPWWFRPVLWFEHNFPWAVDLIVEQFFVKRFQK